VALSFSALVMIQPTATTMPTTMAEITTHSTAEAPRDSSSLRARSTRVRRKATTNWSVGSLILRFFRVFLVGPLVGRSAMVAALWL
jgi:hypothetical protein